MKKEASLDFQILIPKFFASFFCSRDGFPPQKTNLKICYLTKLTSIPIFVKRSVFAVEAFNNVKWLPGHKAFKISEEKPGGQTGDFGVPWIHYLEDHPRYL